MKTTYRQAAYQALIALTLLLVLGCTPTKGISDCECEHNSTENGILMPGFGFSPGGTCNDETLSDESSAEGSESEDDFLKDIEEPLDSPSSDLAVTLEEEKQTS
ncbi:MAG: hypothetical protein D3904_04360 [Candidatus Electrothrix sp. EH2]|nr:hypothetical protein [Candidatus Electrothrix sp. EH2]